MKKEKAMRMAVSLPAELMEEFEKSIRNRAYSNRSKAVADVFREHLANVKRASGKGMVIGTITLLYDHHARGVTGKLTEMQHDFGGAILSSLHVHLDHDNCLEVIVAKGNAKRIELLANGLIATRGVKHGKLAFFAPG